MTDAHAIDALGWEHRTFAPSETFKRNALITDRLMYDDAAVDYEGFWARQAADLLTWSKDWDIRFSSSSGRQWTVVSDGPSRARRLSGICSADSSIEGPPSSWSTRACWSGLILRLLPRRVAARSTTSLNCVNHCHS